MLAIAKKNRQSLFNQLAVNSIAILPSAGVKYRSNDLEYPFRQNSDFFYLTAFNEPNSLAIFIKNDNKPLNNQFILFHQRLDPVYKTWNGDLASSELIMESFGADQVYYIDQLETVLPGLLVAAEVIYYPTKDVNFINSIYKILEIINKFNNSKVSQNLLPIIHELRVFKSDLELEKIRYVTKVSSEAHQHVMQYVATNRNLTERHVQAEFYRYCLQHGCDEMAYPPIVAAGENACVLHYHKNSALIKTCDLLLIDAGAEYNYYNADVTRVFPVSGKFNDQQKAVYDLVLFAQKQAITKIKPGEIWSNIQQKIIEILVEGLKDLKILHGSKSDLIANAAYKDFYMHNSGHFLGLDVHDVGSYKIGEKFRPLAAGMVLTVEPGLYFSSSSKVAPEWHGIGIRIEDDILVTDYGYEILTSSAIKEIAEIQNLMLN